ncbi:MAG: hypothetical protein ABI321_03295 [Polyangia bacterium]
MFKPRRALAAAAVCAALAGPGLIGCESHPSSEPSHALPPLPDNVADKKPPGPLPHAEHPLAEQPTVDPVAAEHEGVDPHAGSEPHAQMAGPNPHGGPPAEPMTPGNIEFDKNTVIAGQLKLDGKTKDKVKAGDTMFIVVRGAATAGAPGPVLAVRRLEAAAFPMPFQIDSRDAMVAGTAMHAPVTLTVRVDKDGDAMSKNPGDVVGTSTIKALPAPSVQLVLDTVLP